MEYIYSHMKDYKINKKKFCGLYRPDIVYCGDEQLYEEEYNVQWKILFFALLQM
jgi:hypothetical protein